MKHFFFIVLIFCAGACTSSRNARLADANMQTVIATARSYTGTPYRYGGTTRNGMDCSGLLCVSYQSAGLQLPRTSDAQSKMGKPVTLGGLRPGDLLFFAAKKGRKKISHVGMVTAIINPRDIRFIHSSTKLGVVENNLHSKYYKSIFVKARRPF